MLAATVIGSYLTRIHVLAIFQRGAQVFVEGIDVSGPTPKVLKSKVWEAVLQQLRAEAKQPLYARKCLQSNSGACSLPDDISDGSSIR
jgi:hypothetical protein